MTDARPVPSAGQPPTGPGPEPATAPARWRPSRPAAARADREDLRSALVTVLVLAVTGLAAGAVWWWLAPRADYRVTATDVEPIGTAPSPELFVADDGVFVLVLAGLGLLAGIAVWSRRRRRGALSLTALATGMLAAGVVAWQLGELVAPRPTHAQLTHVGARITTGLALGATAALAVGPFVAVLVYLVAAALTARDDLGRPGEAPAEPPVVLPGPPLPPVPPPPTR